MIITLIAAVSQNRGIGLENDIPWHLSDDLKRFKKITMGHHMVMGRKTFESLGGKLPGRVHIILTRSPNYQAEGCVVVHSLDQAFAYARQQGEVETFVIGGGEIYRQALSRADRICLTRVHAEVQADTFFPNFDESQWQVAERWFHPADENNDYPSTFMVLERKEPA